MGLQREMRRRDDSEGGQMHSSRHGKRNKAEGWQGWASINGRVDPWLKLIWEVVLRVEGDVIAAIPTA